MIKKKSISQRLSVFYYLYVTFPPFSLSLCRLLSLLYLSLHLSLSFSLSFYSHTITLIHPLSLILSLSVAPYLYPSIFLFHDLSVFNLCHLLSPPRAYFSSTHTHTHTSPLPSSPLNLSPSLSITRFHKILLTATEITGRSLQMCPSFNCPSS